MLISFKKIFTVWQLCKDTYIQLTVLRDPEVLDPDSGFLLNTDPGADIS
jgi:hypothetical protein